MPIQRFVIDESSVGLRLDVYLTRNAVNGAEPKERYTRTEIQRLIDQGQVALNGARAKASVRLKLDDRVEFGALPPRPSSLEPEALPLAILYEDEDLIAINKAAGMIVHPAAGRSTGTLVHALLHHCPELKGVGDERRPGIVHRLDQDTSGVIVVAKTAAALHSLAAQFKSRTVKKEYLALVWGKLSSEKGIIDRPIGRHRFDRKRMSSLRFLKKARNAATEWKVEEEFALSAGAHSRQWLSLLRLYPRTGRTHQIRVHLADFGHPLVGDPLYGRKRQVLAARSTALSEAVCFPRQALHAERLIIEQPKTGKPMDFWAPLPDDLSRLLYALRKHRADCSQILVRGVDNKTAFK
ncbi:MAG TPA: RluA family pseudouridine synthase [Candidatus Binatia bacterium]|nr:RluA family pseudouridine synthase [Candidatus Binatia bacterium]